MVQILGTEVASAVQTSLPSAPYPAVALSIPPGLGWDQTRFPISLSLYDSTALSSRAIGAVSQTAEGLFNAYSTALSNPGATFYANIATGNDSTGTGTQAAPFASIYKAVQAANAAGVPSKIVVAAGIYPRSNGPASSSGVVPTVDVAFVAIGGRVVTGTFDQFAAPAKDGTYTNTYSYATGASDRVMDLVGITNPYGNYPELLNVATPALCNITPGSWCFSSGNLYINRADGAAVTSANTRVLRGVSYGFFFSSQVNVYIGDGGGAASFPPSGFDVEGGSNNGSVAALSYTVAAPNNAQFNVLSVKNSTFKYAGGIFNTNGARGVSVDSLNGLAAFFNCRADANQTDGFNHHNTYGAALPLLLTVNCSGADNGRQGYQSCNGWTSHETCIGIDLAGLYQDNRGGTFRTINNARGYLAGSAVRNDRGDVALGGTLQPDAFSTLNSATYWCERTKADVPPGTSAYMAESAGASIYLRNPAPTAGVAGGPGTVSNY